MTDPRLPRDEPADDGELLSAYLDGDLDPAAEAALEARLELDPELGEQLESTRRVVEALATLRATPPPGYHDRVRARIAGERQRVGREHGAPRAVPGYQATAAAPHTAPGPAGGGRPQRGPRTATGPGRPSGRSRWAPALTAAASVVVLGLLGGVVVIGGLGGQDSDMAADEPALDEVESADEEARLFAQDDVETDGDDGALDVTEEAVQEHGDAGVSAAPAVGEPVMLEDGAVLGDAAAAREHLESRAGTVGVLGLPLDAAEDVALAFRVAIQRAEPFTGGIRPEQCLDEVTAGAAGPAVPVVVEVLTFEGRQALAYLVVTATDGSDILDRIEGWVVDPNACATRLFTPLAP